ncbi:tetratricopeptide repeat protein [Streptomyces sp. M41]|uniref:tetratricopeptide repeat protein n=1 Tax=Streptomyces sp. M41 TaxID=3059412 RepID=UPI00374D6F54
MTYPVDPAVLRVHAEVVEVFRAGTGDLAGVCRAARDRLAGLPGLDAREPRSWSSYRLVTADALTLLGYLRETGVETSEPASFRALLIDVLRYLYEAEQPALGVLPARFLHQDWTARLGASHAATVDVAERLAACLFALGETEQSRPLFEEVLRLRTRVRGADDPATLLAACNLGACLALDQVHDAALRLTEDTAERCERLLGADHETTLLAIANLAATLSALGAHDRVLALRRDVLARRRRISGEDSVLTLRAEAGVADTLHELGQHEAARALNAALLPRFERVAGRDHSGTRRTRARLEQNLRALGRDEEADEVGGKPRF